MSKKAHALPPFWPLVKDCLAAMNAQRKLFILLGLLYVGLTYVFLAGFSQLDFAHINDTTVKAVGAGWATVVNAGLLLMSSVSGTLSGSASDLQQFWGELIALIFWVSALFVARAGMQRKAIKLRDVVYGASGPLIRLALLILLITLQIVPFAIVLSLFLSIQGAGLHDAIGISINLAMGLLTLGLGAVTLYWLGSSLLALVLVADSDQYPLQAVRTVTTQLRGRRWRVVWRLVALALLFVAAWAVVIIPVLYINNFINVPWLPLVPFVVQIVGVSSLLFSSVYMFKLWRACSD